MASRKVLVVDDDAHLRKEIQLRLGDRGIECIEASNEAEAMAVLAQRPDEIGVILVDMRFPTG